MKNAELNIFKYGYWLNGEVAPHFCVGLFANTELLQNSIIRFLGTGHEIKGGRLMVYKLYIEAHLDSVFVLICEHENAVLQSCLVAVLGLVR